MSKKSMPFTYLIGWSKHNLWYYGVRYAFKCHPTDLWSKYFTSSKYVAETRKLYGEPDIIQIRKIFDTSEAAIKWEAKVIGRMKLHENTNFLNKTSSGAIHYDEVVREKIRVSALGNKKTIGYTNEYRAKNGMKLIPGKPKGAKHSDHMRLKRSESMKGTAVHTNLKRPIGIPHSLEARKNLSIAAKNRESFFCEKCNKKITGKMNWDRHLASAKHQSQFVCL